MIGHARPPFRIGRTKELFEPLFRTPGCCCCWRSPVVILVLGLKAGNNANWGSARNEVRGRARTTNELYLMDAVIEPERLAQISLGQENPRMRMNAAPGSRTIRTRTLKGFHNAFCIALSGQNAGVSKKPGALPQADRLWPVGPNRSVSVGFQKFVGLCRLPHFPMTSASP